MCIRRWRVQICAHIVVVLIMKFRGVSQSLHADAAIVPQSISLPLPCNNRAICYRVVKAIDSVG